MTLLVYASVFLPAFGGLRFLRRFVEPAWNRDTVIPALTRGLRKLRPTIEELNEALARVDTRYDPNEGFLPYLTQERLEWLTRNR
jgi:hypothetical protein